jgi:response regulator of citrate/malate metabolism
MKVFILEDDPNRMKTLRGVLISHEIVWSDTVDKAKELFDKEKPFDLILLDHDLGGEIFVDSELPNTGFQFVKFLAENKEAINNAQIILHTMNRPGAERMHHHLKDNGILGFMIPFPILLQSLRGANK